MDKNISLSDDISSSSYQVIQEMTSAQSRMHSLLDNLDKISKDKRNHLSANNDDRNSFYTPPQLLLDESKLQQLSNEIISMTVADNILIDDDDIDAITDNVDNIYKSINDTKIKNKLRLSKLMNKLDNAVISETIKKEKRLLDVPNNQQLIKTSNKLMDREQVLVTLKKEYQENLLLLEQQRTKDNQSKLSIRQGLIKIKMKEISQINGIIRQQNLQMHEKMTELKNIYLDHKNGSRAGSSGGKADGTKPISKRSSFSTITSPRGQANKAASKKNDPDLDTLALADASFSEACVQIDAATNEMISLVNKLIIEEEKTNIQQMKFKAVSESLESTELDKLISKCINLQTNIEKENNTIDLLEKEFLRWSSKFPEHESDFEAYVLNSIRRRATNSNPDAADSLGSSRKSFSTNTNTATIQKIITNESDNNVINSVIVNNDDDDNNDEYAKVIHQIFPYQEGLLKTCTQMLLPVRSSASPGIFANPKPSLSSHSYRSTVLPPKKPISTVGADALKFMEKGYEDYQFQEDYGLKEAVQQSSIILELLEDIQKNNKSKFNSNDDISRLDNLRSDISYQRLLLAGSIILANISVITLLLLFLTGKSKHKKMLLRRLKKIETNVAKKHKEVLKLRSKLYGMITMGNENEITVTCKSDFDALVQTVKDLEIESDLKSAEVETAKQVLDKLRNDKFDIIYDEDGKVSYHEKIINNDGVNNIIKVIIQMNDSVDDDDDAIVPILIKPIIDVDVEASVESSRKKEEEVVIQPLVEVLDVEMKTFDDAISETSDEAIDELRPPDSWMPTSVKDDPLIATKKSSIKRYQQKDLNRRTRNSLHDPKFKSEKVKIKQKAEYNVVSVTNEAVELQDEIRTDNYLIKAMKGNNLLRR